MQAIIEACKAGRLAAKPCVVISNNSTAEALARAEKEGIPHYHLSARTHPVSDRLDEAIRDTLLRHDAQLVILAGYMKPIGPRTLRRFKGRIINIHPSLLPVFGGQGMYGARVHEAVLAAGVKETGVTIHIVDEKYDNGPTLAQCRVPVLEHDTVEFLSQRVLEREHSFLVETLERIISGSIILPAI